MKYTLYILCTLHFFFILVYTEGKIDLTLSPWFLPVCRTSLLKTLWEKEKLLVTSNFSFSHSVFYLFEELSSTFIKPEIVVCEPLSVWKSLKCVIWETVNPTVFSHFFQNIFYMPTYKFH